MEKITPEELMKMANLSEEDMEKITGGGKTMHYKCSDRVYKQRINCNRYCGNDDFDAIRCRAACEEEYQKSVAKCID